MKTVNSNSILGVMRLFNNERYYKNAIKVFWILRDVAYTNVEQKNDGGYGPDFNHSEYWIAELTNEIIGRCLINGYSYIACCGEPYWYVSKPRKDGHFLTYKEAEIIADMVNDKNLMDELYNLRDSVGDYANDINNPLYNIYKVTNDLIEALNGHKLLCA